MKQLGYELFFDLSSYKWASLFKKGVFVWQALFDLKEFFKTLPLGNIQSDIPKGVTLVNKEKISIGKGVVIEPGAYIEGPALIGDHTKIGHTAYLRPYVLTGEGCVIGHASEVKHSIFLNRAKAPHFNYVGDSILGNETNLGAGAICANLRLDHKCVSVSIQGQKIPTGLKKMGAIIGDHSQIGCHAVLNPGLLLKKRSLIRACQAVSESTVQNEKVIHV